LFYINLEDIPEDDLDLLEKTWSHGHENIKAMLKCYMEMENGVCINNKYYDYDEVKNRIG